MAESANLSIDGAIRHITAQVRQHDPDDAPPLPRKRFGVIYADPPWQYEHTKTNSRKVKNHYPTMTLDDICSLDVASIAATGAVLFLWATNPKMTEAAQVIGAWGFTYRTNIAWVKDKIGMGYYARQKHELLLIATAGDVSAPEPPLRPESVITAPRGKHSEKPERFYERRASGRNKQPAARPACPTR